MLRGNFEKLKLFEKKKLSITGKVQQQLLCENIILIYS